MHIQIGNRPPSNPNEIDNPEFYTLSMKIMDDAEQHNERIKANKRREQAEIKRKKQDDKIKSMPYAIAIVLILWTMLHSCGK